VIGKRDRRAAFAVTAALVAAAFAFPALAAAEAAEEGAVVEYLAPSQGPWGHWTEERLEEAEPLPIITLPGPESPNPATAAPETPPAAQPTFASTAALAGAVTGQTSALGGVEVAAAESTVFPNSVNGKLFGAFEISVGPHEVKKEDYVCSGSVVNSLHGNLVLTAGHCVIDPETGTVTNAELVFIPGYRNGGTSLPETAPYGIWRAEKFATTETWKKTAKSGSTPNEGGDLAFVTLRDNSEDESVESVVGSSLEAGFDTACNQVYTQFGYPAEAPYDGEVLYSHTAAYAGVDTNPFFSPEPMKIASDFTRGSSGGPWAIGLGSTEARPTALSLTAYGYENQPGYLYGPYFGEAAKKAYGAAFGQILPAGIEEACTQLPTPPEAPKQTTPTPPPTTVTPETTPPTKEVVTLKVTRVHRRANGSAVLTAKVNAAGMLKLSGSAVRAETLDTPAAGQYRLVVAPKGPISRRLLQEGRATVGVKVAFSASGRTERVSRAIQLSRRSAGQSAQQPAPQFR
jgi:V8-like Glu-specific endopeptidase